MSHQPPLLLAITSHLPWPLNSGGHLRTFHLLKSLAAQFRVRLVAGVVGDSRAGAVPFVASGISLAPVLLPERRLASEALRALHAGISGEPYVLYRRHDRAQMWSTVRSMLSADPPAVVYLDHLDSVLFEQACPGLPVIIDLHNVYSTLARRAAAEHRNILARAYIRREAHLLRRMERRAAIRADLLFAVSPQERDYYHELGAKSAFVIPNGVDAARYADFPVGRSHRGEPSLLFLGSLSWPPNISAVHFLAETVLPTLRAHVPAAKLLIVGCNPSSEIRALATRPGVTLEENVADVRPYLQESFAMVVPLETGGGTRLKILEAFAAGLPVVSTPIGCEGIDAEHGKHLIVALREEFSTSLLSLIDHPEATVSLAAAARRLAMNTYDWKIVGRNATQRVADLLGCARDRVPTLQPMINKRVYEST